MTDRSVIDLPAAVEGRVLFQEPLARYTTYRIGGPAAALVEPRNSTDVVRTVEFARERGVPWTVIGLGSNLLVGDRGFPGIVLRMGKAIGEIWEGGLDRSVWRVGAGFPIPLLARRTAECGWAGVHRLIGVPGTVGGGVYMNAGAHGQEFKDVVREVTLVTADGTVETRRTSDLAWRYRASGLGNVAVLEVTVEFAPEQPKRLHAEIESHLTWRKAGTPFTEACCGSVFRNPAAPVAGPHGELRTAGQLIAAAGMKGFRVGGAVVSPVHANYIVNTGAATARDVLDVIDTVRKRVVEAFDVELELEVRIVGEE